MRALFLGWSVVMMAFPAQSGAEVVFADANGRTIAPVVGEPFVFGFRMAYIDNAGLIWALDPITATVSARAADARWYTEPNCTGPAYVSGYYPRQVFTIVNTPGAWVCRDEVAAQVLRAVSFDDGQGCQSTNTVTWLIPESGLRAVDCTPPDLSACPPLHIERRDPK